MRSPLSDGWDELHHTAEGYTLRIPETWSDFDPLVEGSLARKKAESISPCYAALLNDLLGAERGFGFSLLAFDDAMTAGNPSAIPGALAVSHAEAPAALPITLLIPAFSQQMKSIEGVTVIGAQKRPEINGMGAAQLILAVEGLCDAQGQSVSTSAYQVYLLDGTDIFVVTLITPDVAFEDYGPTFDVIAESFDLSQ